MAPAAMAAKKSEDKSGHESNSDESEAEVEPPAPKKRKREKQAPRKSVAKDNRPRHNEKDVSYKDQC